MNYTLNKVVAQVQSYKLVYNTICRSRTKLEPDSNSYNGSVRVWFELQIFLELKQKSGSSLRKYDQISL